jgi:hypothetical protein
LDAALSPAFCPHDSGNGGSDGGLVARSREGADDWRAGCSGGGRGDRAREDADRAEASGWQEHDHDDASGKGTDQLVHVLSRPRVDGFTGINDIADVGTSRSAICSRQGQ